MSASYLLGGLSVAGVVRFGRGFSGCLEVRNVGAHMGFQRPVPTLVAGPRYEREFLVAGLNLRWQWLWEPQDGPIVFDGFVGLRF